jgi:hypothetical protein
METDLNTTTIFKLFDRHIACKLRNTDLTNGIIIIIDNNVTEP